MRERQELTPPTPVTGPERTGSLPRRRRQDNVRLPTLRVVAGTDLLSLHTIYPAERVEIGRDRRSNLHLTDASVSRRHAIVSELNGLLILEDQGSTNGTMIGDLVVTGPVTLPIGEVFYVGEVALRVDHMTVDEIRHLEHLAERLRLVARDPLTGLLGRAWLQEELDAIVQRGLTQDRPMAALFVDVDHFKHINDTWGHVAGDAILREVAGVLSGAVRETDKVIRYGGDEFLILLVDCPPDAVPRAAERLRLSITRHAWAMLGIGPTSVTASLGGASLVPDDRPSVWLARADAAMYGAKRAGRNRTVVAKVQSAA